jgi:LmbE family N-acetylglucosaminyl deacetylase
MVTHDPIGGYKHPDHIAMHQASRRAFELAADPNFISDLPAFQPARLYYQTIPKILIRWAVRLAPVFGMDPHHFGRNKDIDLATIVAEGDFPTHVRINCRSVGEIRDEATACHTSQLDGGIARKGPMTILRRYFGMTETFMQAYPPPEKGLHEKDLFEGI